MTPKKIITLLVLVTLMLTLVALIPRGATGWPIAPTGGSQVSVAFTGGSVWTSGSSGTCIWFFPILGNLPLTSLFERDATGAPVIDKEHAYFIWVSDWNIEAGAANSGFGGTNVSLAVIPVGTATIYYSDNPTGRDWSNTNNRSTWGVPVATFVRGAVLFMSPDNWANDKFYFSAPLLNSEPVTLNGQPFNFRYLMPHGMSCFEYGQNGSTTETGSCLTTGD